MLHAAVKLKKINYQFGNTCVCLKCLTNELCPHYDNRVTPDSQIQTLNLDKLGEKETSFENNNLQ